MARPADRGATRSALFSFWEGQGGAQQTRAVRTALESLERFQPSLYAALECAHVRHGEPDWRLEEKAVDVVGELLAALNVRPERNAWHR